ncbi:hypothetical protein [Actinocrispum wychmicini]|uniref:Uncharacterized protein n=1 Tax=Actinocrispum wychmicini TaxID=1213861 RepID=A0A4R2J5C8_9PSEU|nr:hypothetical protein [Actinocrispum wychmicini]TCO53097.1 hypothetical protein EV192_111294 [Actinocrispum wychmicini]
MNTISISYRDRAVLRAVAAGRCELAGECLRVDGIGCCDQFAGLRLTQAGLIAAADGPARLTPTGEALLEAA